MKCEIMVSGFQFSLTPYLTGFLSRSKSSRLFSQCSAATTSLSEEKKIVSEDYNPNQTMGIQTLSLPI